MMVGRRLFVEAVVSTDGSINDRGITRATMRVPRSFFDLIPGEPMVRQLSGKACWAKGMLLAESPGHHKRLMVYCHEPPLRECQLGFATGTDAPAG